MGQAAAVGCGAVGGECADGVVGDVVGPLLGAAVEQRCGVACGGRADADGVLAARHRANRQAVVAAADEVLCAADGVEQQAVAVGGEVDVSAALAVDVDAEVVARPAVAADLLGGD